MKQFKLSNEEKINVEDLIKDFRVENTENLKMYLKDIFKDLSERSEDRTKGINKITFLKYYDLPGIISERLFKLFAKENKNFIGFKDFSEGMLTLFSEKYEKLTRLIFDFYDFETTGKISKEDVRVILSYIPLSNSYKKAGKFVKQNFKDRIESQDEIFSILERTFENQNYLDFNSFLNVIENKCSDIFLFILIFLLEKKPFTIKNINEYYSKSTTPRLVPTNKYIASPSLHSKFSPSLIIRKSPFMKTKNIPHTFRNKETTTTNTKFLLQYLNKDCNKQYLTTNKVEEESKQVRSQSTLIRKVTRKRKISMKNLGNDDKNINNINIYDLNNCDLMPAAKYIFSNKMVENNLSFDDKMNKNKANSASNKNLSVSNVSESVDIEDEDNFEGFLYKITEKNTIKKIFFKLFNKHLYCNILIYEVYKNKDDFDHQGMHSLSGVFVKEENHLKVDKTTLFGFSIIFPNQIRIYYSDNEKDFKTWMEKIQKITGYSNLYSIYDVKDKIGTGQYGIVRLGIHKETGKKVAIKILQKNKMSIRELELVRTEIEILKICQHPYIIKLHEIFENYMFIYIIMEYCSGGDLISLLERCNYNIPEEQAASIIHKLSTAIFYLHSYGIAHRDIKAENILLTDSTDKFDIRLVDFGLSKIFGPNELSEEPFGTLSYVGPEVLLKQPYTKKVDLWSIGIITYLLLTGYLPFDDDSSEKVYKMTIYNPTPFPPILWNKISNEAKILVNSNIKLMKDLLQKDPNKRMTIKEVLEHSWIQKYCKSNVTELRKNTDNICDFKVFSSTSI